MLGLFESDGRCGMKLYWRVKIDGKWTYKAAYVHDTRNEHGGKMVYVFLEDGKFDETQVS